LIFLIPKETNANSLSSLSPIQATLKSLNSPRVLQKFKCSFSERIEQGRKEIYVCRSIDRRGQKKVILASYGSVWTVIATNIKSKAFFVSEITREGNLLYVANSIANDEKAFFSSSNSFSKNGRFLSSLRVDSTKSFSFLNFWQDNGNRIELEIIDGKKVFCKRAPAVDDKTCAFFLCDSIFFEKDKYDTFFWEDEIDASNIVPKLRLSKNTGSKLGPSLDIKRIFSIDENENRKIVTEVNQDQALSSPRSNIKLPKDIEHLEDTFAYYGLIPQESKNREKALAKCKSQDLLSLIEQERLGVNNIRERVLKDEMIQLVNISPEKWLSEILFTSRLPDTAFQLNKGVFLSDSDQKKAADWNLAYGTKVRSILTIEEAEHIFQEMANQKDIPFEYKRDGCFAKAHVIADRMEKMGIYSEKVWIFGDLEAPGEIVYRWGFHVAPVIWVKTNNDLLERRIIDPALAKRILSIDEWIKLTGPTNRGKLIFSNFPPPSNHLDYDRPIVSFSPSSFYVIQNDPNPDAQEKMRRLWLAEVTNKQHEDELNGRGVLGN